MVRDERIERLVELRGGGGGGSDWRAVPGIAILYNPRQHQLTRFVIYAWRVDERREYPKLQ